MNKHPSPPAAPPFPLPSWRRYTWAQLRELARLEKLGQLPRTPGKFKIWQVQTHKYINARTPPDAK